MTASESRSPAVPDDRMTPVSTGLSAVHRPRRADCPPLLVAGPDRVRAFRQQWPKTSPGFVVDRNACCGSHLARAKSNAVLEGSRHALLPDSSAQPADRLDHVYGSR
jgi:hypothetical protein